MTMTDDRRHQRDENRLRREAKGRDAQRDRAYKAGMAGEDIPFEGEDDELHELYSAGQEDRAKADDERGSPSARGSGRQKRAPSARSSGPTRRRARAVYRAAARSASGGSSVSVLGLIGMAFGLVLLYLLLSNAQVLTAAAGGVSRFFAWLIDPTRGVPPHGGS
jgi:hypothetical protein